MKLKLFLFFVLLIGFDNLFAQSPAWEWEISEGGNKNDALNSISVDDSGNVYATGLFYSSSINFGSFTLYKDSIGVYTAAIYFVKYDNAGNVIWAKSAGGNRRDFGADIKIDKQNNLYLTGGFQSPKINFDNDTLFKDTTIYYLSDIFVVKLDDNGSVLWAKREGGTKLDEGQSICSDIYGNVFVTGIFQSPIMLFGNDTLTSIITDNIFLIKYDSLGNTKWGKCGKGIQNDNEGYHVCCDGYGNVYVMGQFYNDTISFDNYPLINVGNTSDDYFLVKYDSSGNLLWAKREGDIDFDFGNSICTVNQRPSHGHI